MSHQTCNICHEQLGVCEQLGSAGRHGVHEADRGQRREGEGWDSSPDTALRLPDLLPEQ